MQPATIRANCHTFTLRRAPEIARCGVPVVTFDVQLVFASGLSAGFEVQNWTGQSFANLRSNRPKLLEAIIQEFGRHPMGEDIPADWSSSERRKRPSVQKVHAEVAPHLEAFNKHNAA